MIKVSDYKREQLLIKKLTGVMIKKLVKNDQLFKRFSEINKGFIDETVLRTIARNKTHEHYDDLFQAAWLGLYKSLSSDKFNPERASFSTFATIVMMNEVRQEIKRLNKQKHVIKRKDGQEGYNHLETALENFAGSNNKDNKGNEYNESHWKDTPRIVKLRNFDEEMLNEIMIKDRMVHFSKLERDVYEMHYVENLSIKKIAGKLDRNYYTLRKAFYEKMKPKFDKLYEDVRG